MPERPKNSTKLHDVLPRLETLEILHMTEFKVAYQLRFDLAEILLTNVLGSHLLEETPREEKQLESRMRSLKLNLRIDAI